MSDEQKQKPSLESVVDRNIRALLERRAREQKKEGVDKRLASSITNFTANMAFIYVHVAVFGIWIAWNLGVFHLKPFDPSFTGLMLTTAIEAIFLTTFVLMNQRNLDAQADKRADLDLHISLLSEHEITKLISLVKRIAKKLEIEQEEISEFEVLEEDVHPDKVIDILEKGSEGRRS